MHMIWSGSFTLGWVITLLYDNSAFCLEPHEKDLTVLNFTCNLIKTDLSPKIYPY